MELAGLGDLHPTPFAAEPAESPPNAPQFGLHELAGQVGAEVAAPLSAALERVNQLATTGQIGRQGLRALRAEIERARRVAMMGQQIARLASGRVKPAPETLDLPQLLRDLIAQRRREIEAHGFEVRQVLSPAKVSADPALMFTLLQAVVDWAFEHCCQRTIHLHTEVRNWPVRGQLMCEFAWRQADEVDTEAGTEFEEQRRRDALALDTMAWRLVERAAYTLGAIVERNDTPWQVHLLLEFPLATAPSGAPERIELPTPDSASMGLNSEPLAGSHVLVVSSRREVRNLVREALRSMGLMVDYVNSTEEASEFCRGGLPHAIVYDGALAGFEQFKGSLRDEVSGLAFLQITDDATALEVDGAGPDQDVRVGLTALVDALPPALGYALSRAR